MGGLNKSNAQPSIEAVTTPQNQHTPAAENQPKNNGETQKFHRLPQVWIARILRVDNALCVASPKGMSSLQHYPVKL